MKFCIDCKSYGWNMDYHGEPYCQHPETRSESPVFGTAQVPCSTARSSLYGKCGIVAKFFEEKAPEVPKPRPRKFFW